MDENEETYEGEYLRYIWCHWQSRARHAHTIQDFTYIGALHGFWVMLLLVRLILLLQVVFFIHHLFSWSLFLKAFLLVGKHFTFLKIFRSIEMMGVYIDFRLDLSLFSSVSTHLRQSAIDHLLVWDVMDAENVTILDLFSVHFCKCWKKVFLTFKKQKQYFWKKEHFFKNVNKKRFL